MAQSDAKYPLCAIGILNILEIVANYTENAVAIYIVSAFK